SRTARSHRPGRAHESQQPRHVPCCHHRRSRTASRSFPPPLDSRFAVEPCVSLAAQVLRRDAILSDDVRAPWIPRRRVARQRVVILRQYYLGGLAHASYLLADDAGGGEAAVVDPQRDVDQYVE